jgi:glyoxylase-like metal-dependent hydrolase (beta-lactamase superfamily II)
MNPKIHVYTAPADKFFVNSFLIETLTGVIVVDTQFLVSTAEALGARLDALGKPLAAVIITHPHPDHYNGLPVLMRNRAPVPVYANHIPEADALIASDLIYNGAHPWLAEHRTSSWLRQLDDVQSRFGNLPNIYAGHGQPGTADLFDMQRRYIEDFRKLVAKYVKNAGLSTEAVEAIVAETALGREGWPLAGLIAMNASAVAEEHASAAR